MQISTLKNNLQAWFDSTPLLRPVGPHQFTLGKRQPMSSVPRQAFTLRGHLLWDTGGSQWTGQNDHLTCRGKKKDHPSTGEGRGAGRGSWRSHGAPSLQVLGHDWTYLLHGWCRVPGLCWARRNGLCSSVVEIFSLAATKPEGMSEATPEQGDLQARWV